MVKRCRPLRGEHGRVVSVLLLFVWAVLPRESAATEPIAARSALPLAEKAARAWAPDATLLYLENDEALAPDGRAERWGFLYHSALLARSRAYSVEAGRIAVAEDCDLRFQSAPISSTWIDSEAALAKVRGEETQLVEQTPAHMLLVRGPLDDREPDRTSWLLVFPQPDGTSRFVVFDATSGEVRRRWNG